MNNDDLEQCEVKLKDAVRLAEMLQDEQLAYCCQCLEKMRRVYVKVRETEMLSYIRKILDPFFPLAVDHFCDRIQTYKDAITGQKNKTADGVLTVDVYEDIKKSVLALSEAMEFIIQSSNKADRMLIQSIPINSGLLYSVPKMSAYFSQMLNTLAGILQNGMGSDYAFCVFPAIQYRSEAKVLFLTRQQRGKTALIRIPSADLMQVNYLRILLVHELFHVILIPESIQRKERAIYYFKILLHDIEGKLYDGLPELNQNQRGRLDRMLLAPITDAVSSKFKGKGDEERIFYSRQIQAFMTSTILDCLPCILSLNRNEIYECLYGCEKECSNYSEYEKRMSLCEEIIGKMTENAIMLMKSSVISEVAALYMRIFREVLSDLSTVWTLRPKPESWIRSFHYHAVRANDQVKMPTQYMRISLVISTLAQAADRFEMHNPIYSYLKMWSDYQENLQNASCSEPFLEGIADYIGVLSRNKNTLNAQADLDSEGNVLQFQVMYNYYKDFFIQRLSVIIAFEEEHGIQFERFRKRFLIGYPDYGTEKCDQDYDLAIIEHLAKRKWEER